MSDKFIEQEVTIEGKIETRMSALEENVIQDRNRLKELQTEVSHLNQSVQRALQDLMPKVEALLLASQDKVHGAVNNPPSATQAIPSITSVESTAAAPVLTSSSSTISILEAAESGDNATLLQFLEVGANVRQRNKYGDTALHLAASNGHEAVIESLIGSGADVNVLGPKLQTALHRAAENGHLRAVRRLLSLGAIIDAKDSERCSPLMLAAREGASSIVSLLLSHGASPSDLDKNGNTALITAIKSDHLDVVETFAMRGFLDDTDNEGNSAMVHAAKLGAWEMVILLCEKGASTKKYVSEENSPLLIASENGHVKALSCLMQSPYPPSSMEMEKALSRAKGLAVVWAFEDANPGTLRGVVRDDAMRQAAYDGRLDTLIALLDAGVNIDAKSSDNDTALICACEKGRTECVIELLKRGALKNIKYKNSDTALHIASLKGFTEIVQLLLQAGFDTTVRDNKGRRPIDIAGNKSVKQLFRDYSKT